MDTRRGYRRELAPNEINEERAKELGKCISSYVYFIHNYCKIYDSVDKAWIPFKLWPDQRKVLNSIHENQLTVILKARQLGISWLCLGYGLWQMLFEPIAAVSIFSRRETEAIYLMGQDRMRGMFNHLPLWMRTGHGTEVNSGREWVLETGSACRAFPTSAGDSYVSTLALVDEADLSPDLNKLMGAVKPTIDNGGKLILLSRSNKREPNSEFKQVYRGATKGENGWYPVFLPWHSHPGRDTTWYDRQRRDILSRTGALDDLYEQYPETDAQALAAATLDKRIPPHWIEPCFEELPPVMDRNAPGLTKLIIYKSPTLGARYVIGADPAEGNPNSDDSALTVVDVETGEEVASFAGKYEPAIFASYIAQISEYYGFAPVLVERNNHGHSVIQWLEEHARRVRLLLGHDSEKRTSKEKKVKRRRRTLKYGWLSSKLGKTILYTACTEHFRQCVNLDNPESSVKVLHNRITFSQLLSIEAETLSAPQGDNDDRADSYALTVVARRQLIGKANSASLKVMAEKGWGI